MEKSGLSNRYYELPEGCQELQDLIEYKQMNFAIGNMFKAIYRLGEKDGNTKKYDLEKIIWFAQREIERIQKDEKGSDRHRGINWAVGHPFDSGDKA